MKATAKQAKNDATKRTYQSVPFDEMRRLMRVYGSTKCLRKRQASDGTGVRKIVSVKRKFYRWFPDLEERFVRDAGGFYRPKFGHEFEMRYRQDLRAKDEKILASKRVNRRKQRLGVGNVKKVMKKAANPSIREVTASAISSGATIASASDCALGSPVSFRDIRDIDLKFETDNDRSASIPIIADAKRHTGCTPASPKSHSNQEPSRVEERLGVGNAKKVVKKVANPNTRGAIPSPIMSGTTIASASDCAPVSPAPFRDIGDIDLKLETDGYRSASISITPDSGPLDGSFVAKHGIFDDVERSFFAREDSEVQNLSALPLVSDREISDCPGLQSSSSNSSTSSDEEPCSSTSRGSDPLAEVHNFPVLPLFSSLSRGGASADEEPRPGASRGGDSSFVDRDIDDMLGGSMEEYCEDILLSDGDDGCGPVFHFGAL